MAIDFGPLLDMAADASGTIGSAWSTYRQLRDLAKDRKLPLEFVDRMVTVADRLTDARVKLHELQMEIETLQRAQRALDVVQQRKRNYVLAHTPVGERIYRLKDDAGTGEPAHEVCPACFERDQIRILQPRGTILQCDECKAGYRLKEATPGGVVPSSTDWSGFV